MAGLLPSPASGHARVAMAARRGAPLKGLAHGLHPALRCSMIAKLRTSAPVYSRSNGAGALDLKNQRLASPVGKISPVRFHIIWRPLRILRPSATHSFRQQFKQMALFSTDSLVI